MHTSRGGSYAYGLQNFFFCFGEANLHREISVMQHILQHSWTLQNCQNTSTLQFAH